MNNLSRTCQSHVSTEARFHHRIKQLKQYFQLFPCNSFLYFLAKLRIAKKVRDARKEGELFDVNLLNCEI